MKYLRELIYYIEVHVLLFAKVFLRDGGNYVEVYDSKEAIAVNFYDHRKLRLIGVTGTNGKTTIVHLLL